MHGLALKFLTLLAGVAGIAIAAPERDQAQPYAGQAAPMRAPISDPALTAAIAEWKSLRETEALPFDSYTGFLLRHPGWPNEAAYRRLAERKAATASPASVAGFFRRYPPQSGGAGVAFAQALAAQGSFAEANEAARTAWRRGSLSTQDEATVLGRFNAALTPDDHDTRMDALLWAGAIPAAARQIAYVSPARAGVFGARLALRQGGSAAETAVASEAQFTGDAGYVADRAVFQLASGASIAARQWLAQPRRLVTRPGNVEKWYEVLLVNARAAAADRQWQLVYEITRQIDDAYAPGTVIADRPYGERDDYTSLAWLGGQTALKQLGRPGDAAVLFDRYGKGSNAPQTRSKGQFWAARAYQAAGRSADAAALYAAAAVHREQFYGQLAAERTGLPAPPRINDPIPIAPAARQAFMSRETVRVAQLLGNVADWRDQSLFVRQVALDAKTDSDHRLAEELARQLARPDLSVMIGRSALTNNLPTLAATGYPTVPVPSGYEGNWVLIHAIARQESQFDRAAVSVANARGLMQLMPGTAREQAGIMGIGYDPAALTTDAQLSIRLGSSYFQRLQDRLGSYPLAIAAYNAGGGNVNKWLRANGDPRAGGVDMVDWIEAIPFSETRNYVQRVLENAVTYEQLYPNRARSQASRRLGWYLGQRA